jgi:hypothetical protein
MQVERTTASQEGRTRDAPLQRWRLYLLVPFGSRKPGALMDSVQILGEQLAQKAALKELAGVFIESSPASDVAQAVVQGILENHEVSLEERL